MRSILGGRVFGFASHRFRTRTFGMSGILRCILVLLAVVAIIAIVLFPLVSSSSYLCVPSPPATESLAQQQLCCATA